MGLLKNGSKGSQVKVLQKKLNGFKAGLTVDGIFGPKTDRAVRDFQKSSGLKVDGLVGKNTFAALDMKTSGGKSGGKKASGGKGVSLVDWKLTDAKDRVKRFQKLYAPYPKKHKTRKKEHDAFMPRLHAHLAMSTGGNRGSILGKIKKLNSKLDSCYLNFERKADEFNAYLTQFQQLIERYQNLKKNGKLAEALDYGTEINNQNLLYQSLKTECLSLLVDYDFVHDTMVKLEADMAKEFLV